MPEKKITKAAATWWLYLLACKDGRTYIGITLDVSARFKVHVSGKGAKFTRANRPTAILGAQPFATKSAVLKAEHALKRLNKTAKLQWARAYPETTLY
ncbi:MAG: GIY-YIG nuclease family protein [Candidatus Obscuribacterales bacterium]|nr:GIY-YIG nuclease family protein [Steroidobacteraceae bacterium]